LISQCDCDLNVLNKSYKKLSIVYIFTTYTDQDVDYLYDLIFLFTNIKNKHNISIKRSIKVVCMYVCMYICMYVCTYVSIYSHITAVWGVCVCRHSQKKDFVSHIQCCSVEYLERIYGMESGIANTVTVSNFFSDSIFCLLLLEIFILGRP